VSIPLPAAVTMQRASAVLAELVPLLRHAPGPVVAIDASGVQEVDTSCIALLLQCQRVVQARGLRVAVQGVPAQLAALMSLYGVAELFGVVDSNGVGSGSATAA
jgi:phospholipid transport system transporter-binding protein